MADTSTMRIQVQGHAVHVRQVGAGAPALFLHGVPDTAELWHEVIAGVADRYACYAPDFMGIHRSEVNPRFDYSLDGLADWVEDLVTALGIERPITLACHDWGGVMGLAWACKYPQRVARVVLMDAPFTHLYRWHRWARIWRTPLLGELSMLLMTRWVMDRELRRGGRALSAAQRDAVYSAAPSRLASRFVTLRLYRAGEMRNFIGWDARLAALAARVPLKILWGEHDVYLPRWLTRTFHTDDVEIVADVGHWVPAEAPQRVIAALREPATAVAA